MTSELLRDLATYLPANRIRTALVDRIAYASDAGFYQLIPQVVVFPAAEQEVAALFLLSRKHRIPLVFRAAGTSLSGQTITDGILADISKHWQGIWPLEQGRKVRVQPGVIGSMVNNYLKKYGCKIGPDPASISAAMMGGILSNNASGMCCGVAYNSYHTLHTLRFMLPDGSVYDTAVPADHQRFEQEQAALSATLLQLRQRIHENDYLYQRIRKKYRTKNTVGYSLNAFADYENPLDILAHLMIGAEGTLGFISEAVLHTVPDLPCKSTAMLYFANVRDACHAIMPLKACGAEALELMDRTALRSVEDTPGLPAFFKTLPADAAALLCEFHGSDEADLQAKLQETSHALATMPLLHEAVFTTDEALRNKYWKIRKGLFPSVGAVRARGTTVILEDIAFPVEQLADGILDCQQLFQAFDYNNAIIFGHAKDGNIHFVITQELESQAEVERYDRFMRQVVDMVVNKYDGTLKAEHGTGRNMAPFVEAEWGGEAWQIMAELKNAVDPDNLLNPGVIINKDHEAHIRNLKSLPPVEEEVDKCIECGFCEPHCPSRDVTLTPRQRIQVRRHLKRMQHTHDKAGYKQLLQQYQYAGLDTCAVDGLCQTDCPVQINTGELVKRLRRENHSTTANAVATWVSRHFGKTEWVVRAALHGGMAVNKVLGPMAMTRLTNGLRIVSKSIPTWWPQMSHPPVWVALQPKQPDVVYFSACLNRMMGSHTPHKPGVQQAFVEVCKRAGLQVLLPPNLAGHCCGQAFGSKGFSEAAKLAQEKTIDALLQWSNNGAIPVVCDFTSCTYNLLSTAKNLTAEYREKFDRLTVLDCLGWLHNQVIPKLKITTKKDSVVLHPVCASVKLGLTGQMRAVAAACAHDVEVPLHAGCCGMAGDRGFYFPQLTQGGTRAELKDAVEVPASGYYATGRTCEMALSHFSGLPYEHLLYLVYEASTPL